MRPSCTSADRITDFNSSQADRIRLSRTAFGISATTASISSVSSADAVNAALLSSVLFVYNTTSGELIWNQDGATPGAGSGGLLAVLDNKAPLAAGQFTLY